MPHTNSLDENLPRRRWIALILIGPAQLMVVMNSTLTNVAIPSIQSDLSIDDFNRAWVLAAYGIVFGGFLITGGAVVDRIGSKRAFQIGLVGFAVAAADAGTALWSGQLFVGVALQGVFAALLVPAGVSKINQTFLVARDRSRALAVYGTIAASGAAVGFFLGGILTQYLSWRACCLIHLPIAIIAILGARRFLAPDAKQRPRRINVLGAALLTLGLAALIFAVTALRGSSADLLVPCVVGGAGILSLIAFLISERHTLQRLIPQEFSPA